MFPLEIVLRNTAAGHFCSRLGVEEGIELKEPVLEYFRRTMMLQRSVRERRRSGCIGRLHP